MRTLGRGNPGSSHLRELDSVPPANSLCHVRRHVCSSHGLGVDVFGVRYSAHRRGHSPHTQFRPPPRALQLVGKSSGPWDWMVPTRSFTHSGTAGQRPPSPGPALRDGLPGRGATCGSLLGGLGILARRSPVFGEWSPTGRRSGTGRWRHACVPSASRGAARTRQPPRRRRDVRKPSGAVRGARSGGGCALWSRRRRRRRDTRASPSAKSERCGLAIRARAVRALVFIGTRDRRRAMEAVASLLPVQI